FKIPRAVPALKAALQRIPQERHRASIVRALVMCAGIDAAESSSGIESYIRRSSTVDGRKSISDAIYDLTSAEPLEVTISMGAHLSRQENLPEHLAEVMIARVDQLEVQEPDVARALAEIVVSWPSEAVD